MRTSELAERADVNGETLRYYERRGLLNEPHDGWLSGLPDRGRRVAAEHRRDDLAARIGDLQRMHASLSDLVASCDLPRADRRCALLAAIR
jgi:MerR family mercuric resistance operon transcriptional regulator